MIAWLLKWLRPTPRAIEVADNVTAQRAIGSLIEQLGNDPELAQKIRDEADRKQLQSDNRRLMASR